MGKLNLANLIKKHYSHLIKANCPRDLIMFKREGQLHWTTYVDIIEGGITFPNLLDEVFEAGIKAGIDKGKLDKAKEIRQSLGVV